jgi:hypothetical protein
MTTTEKRTLRCLSIPNWDSEVLEALTKLILVWLGSLLVTIILALVVALPVSILWNWLLPSISNMPEITYVQAAGLVLLVHLILRGARSRIEFKA